MHVCVTIRNHQFHRERECGAVEGVHCCNPEVVGSSYQSKKGGK